MAGLRTMFKRFSSECETKDDHLDEELQTHYYKTSFDKVFDEVEQLFSSSSYTISSASKEHGEIMVQKKGKPGIFIIATILTVRPFQTAVDFKMSTDHSVISGAYPILKKEIVSNYKGLDQHLRRADK
ncbi:hypothetical protein [Jeotgalibacillus soli]|uniref:Cytosolic protein n=1 Tax=Jeotgalibacillus soli TaxID=889306 RepID=A0A0C2R0F2_9BACL|nr:hypothetical protein [Jeotgalibacillus soli]KIL43805.1 hypothetical protein KP78_36290 [Jeotgalibacillus soli]